MYTSLVFFKGTATFNTTQVASTQANTFLAKYNSQGDFQWVRIIECTGYSSGNSITAIPGGVVMTGSYRYIAKFDAQTTITTTTGTAYLFIAKYDNSGTLEWVKTTTQGANYIGSGIYVKNTTVAVTGAFDGNLYFDGELVTTSQQKDVIVTKYSTLSGWI
jgi:hypothetical protein